MTQLLLLHGFTGAPQSWDAVVHELDPSHQVFRPWLLGHGPAQEPSGEASSQQPTGDFDSELERLAQWAFAQGFERGVLGGYSLGGRLALGLCARYPERFRSAVLIGAHPGLQTEAERLERAGEDEHWIQLLQRGSLARFVEQWERRTLFETQAVLEPEARRQQSQIRHLHMASGLAKALRALGLASMPDLRPALAAYPHPLTALVGELDSKFTRLAVQMAAISPTLQLQSASAAGHNLLLESPGWVATILTRHADALTRSSSA